MVAPRKLNPWPADAVMVVASPAGEERREWMEGVHPAVCRDCGRAVHADTYTVRTAWGRQARRGRPVLFFCVPCLANYDRSTVTELHDHSGGKR